MACRVRCRSGASAGPSARTGNRCSSRSSSAAGVNRRVLAAASSIASGRPSSRAQTDATDAAASSSIVKRGSIARARSANNSTAASSASGVTGTSCSPRTWSGARLVARTRRPGAAASSAATCKPASGICSRLSSTRNVSASPMLAARVSSIGSPASWTPSVAAIAATIAPASMIGARSTTWATGVPTDAANSSASRVLPLPPGPVRVISRAVPNSSARSASSRSRPTNDVSRAGGEPASVIQQV